MKKIGKLKLSELNKAELEKKDMIYLQGGDCCACACAGTSPTNQNDSANDSYGYGGSGSGGNCSCCCSTGSGEYFYDNKEAGYE